jgi:hypothetical protein
VQVDPIKSTLKAPGTNPLTLKYDEPLSTFAFKFNLRRNTSGLQRVLKLRTRELTNIRQGVC